MQGPRAATPQELPLVEALANTVFRSSENAPQTMFQEYPDLYDESNLNNIRIITEDGKPVSNINYLPQTIDINGCRVSAATLGGVSTLKDYRGRGYSSLLLNDCIRQMERQGVCVLHVSGDRHMYRMAGCQPAGQVFEYVIAAQDVRWAETGIQLDEADEENLAQITRLYGRECVRYLRTYDRMKVLLNSNKYISAPDMSRPTLVLKKDGVFEAYLVLLIKAGAGHLVEWAGNNSLVLAAAGQIMQRYGLSTLSGKILPQEENAKAFLEKKGISLSAKRLDGTLKIINFIGFMEALRPYFNEHYSTDYVDEMCFTNGPDGISFSCRGAQCIIRDESHLNDLIFGGGVLESGFLVYIGDSSLLQDFFNAVFPLPFIDTGNLNCV